MKELSKSPLRTPCGCILNRLVFSLLVMKLNYVEYPKAVYNLPKVEDVQKDEPK